MKVDYYEGYTTEDGCCICKDCAGPLTEEAEDQLGYVPIFAGQGEWDYFPACAVCGQRFTYVQLTSDGRDYELSLMGNK